MIALIKGAAKKGLAEIMYLVYERLAPLKIRVHSIDETLDELLQTEKSMVRFGDGEIVVLSGRNIFFQTSSPEISDGLKRVIQYQHENLMVTLPDIFDGLEQYVPESQAFWKDHLLFFRKVYYRYCNLEKKYYNTSVSRCYVTLTDKTKSAGWFEKFRRVFQGKKLVVVEGTGTHNGVGNDLFDMAESVERIICPGRNAYSVREKILQVCLEYSKDRLFLFSLGITAKALVEEMFLKGYRVIDIGNLDMEYEWYLRGAVKKEPISKHSIVGEEANRKAGYEKYLSQIVCYIE